MYQDPQIKLLSKERQTSSWKDWFPFIQWRTCTGSWQTVANRTNLSVSKNNIYWNIATSLIYLLSMAVFILYWLLSSFDWQCGPQSQNIICYLSLYRKACWHLTFIILELYYMSINGVFCPFQRWRNWSSLNLDYSFKAVQGSTRI